MNYDSAAGVNAYVVFYREWPRCTHMLHSPCMTSRLFLQSYSVDIDFGDLMGLVTFLIDDLLFKSNDDDEYGGENYCHRHCDC